MQAAVPTCWQCTTTCLRDLRRLTTKPAGAWLWRSWPGLSRQESNDDTSEASFPRRDSRPMVLLVLCSPTFCAGARRNRCVAVEIGGIGLSVQPQWNVVQRVRSQGSSASQARVPRRQDDDPE